MFVKASSSSVHQPQNHVLFAWFVVLGVSRGSLISLSICLLMRGLEIRLNTAMLQSYLH
jgi:hypothetical protein